MENKHFLANLGYTEPLYILPFDHRTGLYKTLGWTEPLTNDQVNLMKSGRMVIYEAIKAAVANGVPKNSTPIFTDDQFGIDVLRQAKSEEFMTFLTTEKSGIAYFDFEHGESFGDAIDAIHPTFTKALVRYNPDGNPADNQKSLANLKRLSDFSHERGYKFVIEPLVPATDEQLASVDGDKHRYDHELRPDLTVRMIVALQNAGIEPDVWKIEGFETKESYAQIVSAAHIDGRDHVGVISLGRNEPDHVVESWLRAGAATPGVIGFAIGRTIFLESLIGFMQGTISREVAIETIARKFEHFYKVFVEAQ